MKAPKLQTLEAFASKVLDLGDLDPVTAALSRVAMDRDQLYRWLVGYWLFFHPGLASYLSQLHGKDFWDAVFEAVKNETNCPVGGRWPRGNERRHMRGGRGEATVTGLYYRFYAHPEDFVSRLTVLGSVYDVQMNISFEYNFGSWISFVAARMLQELFEVPGEFCLTDVLKVPAAVRSVQRVWKVWVPNDKVSGVLHQSSKVIQSLLRYEGRLEVGDAILLLSRWNSYLVGSYRPGALTGHTKKQLLDWAQVSGIAKTLFDTLNNDYPPKEIP